LAAGFSDAQVAATVGVSARTVRRHVAVIMERLEASTRFAAAIAARRRGWL
jgi:DNA-binding NarL/FixJ family response regulator